MNVINRCIRIACLCVAVAAGCVAQTRPAAPAQDNVRNGVSRQYEQSDPYPVYETHIIQVGNGQPYYDPPEITVHAGDLIQWTNKRLSDAHTIIDTAGSFESSPIPAEKNFCYHFVREGDYLYSCRFHPWMKGMVHVRLRELPLAPAPADDAETRSAGFLLANVQAIEAAGGGYWMPGTVPAALLYRAAANAPISEVRIAGLAQRLVPLAGMANGNLVVAAPGFMLLIDPKAKMVVNQLALPKNFNASRAACISTKQVWLTNSQGSILLFVDLEKKVTRARALPAGSRIVAMRQEADQAWALDSGRSVLLKLGVEWSTEVALSEDIKTPRSLAVDSAGQPWFLDSSAGIAGFVQANGIVQQFSVPRAAGGELLHVNGSSVLLLADAAAKHVSFVDPKGSLSGRETQRAADCADPRAAGPVAAIESKESK